MKCVFRGIKFLKIFKGGPYIKRGVRPYYKVASLPWSFNLYMVVKPKENSGYVYKGKVIRELMKYYNLKMDDINFFGDPDLGKGAFWAVRCYSKRTGQYMGSPEDLYPFRKARAKEIRKIPVIKGNMKNCFA